MPVALRRMKMWEPLVSAEARAALVVFTEALKSVLGKAAPTF